MDTATAAAEMLQRGPVAAPDLAKRARVTRRTAQRVLDDLYRAGRAERRKSVAPSRLVYYRSGQEAAAKEEAAVAMTEKRAKVLGWLIAGRWSTTTELRRLLKCGQTEPHRLVADLVGMGLAEECGEVERNGRGGRMPRIYRATEKGKAECG